MTKNITVVQRRVFDLDRGAVEVIRIPAGTFVYEVTAAAYAKLAMPASEYDQLPDDQKVSRLWTSARIDPNVWSLLYAAAPDSQGDEDMRRLDGLCHESHRVLRVSTDNPNNASSDDRYIAIAGNALVDVQIEVPAERTFYKTRWVRIGDLKNQDVARYQGRWWYVANTYRKEEDVIAEYGDGSGWAEQIAAKLDDASEQQLLVRFLDDVASTVGQIQDRWELLVENDLIEIQVPLPR